MDIDRLLVQLWGSHALRMKIIYYVPEEQKEVMYVCIRGLLPEIMERGIP